MFLKNELYYLFFLKKNSSYKNYPLTEPIKFNSKHVYEIQNLRKNYYKMPHD